MGAFAGLGVISRELYQEWRPGTSKSPGNRSEPAFFSQSRRQAAQRISQSSPVPNPSPGARFGGRADEVINRNGCSDHACISNRRKLIAAVCASRRMYACNVRGECAGGLSQIHHRIHPHTRQHATTAHASERLRGRSPRARTLSTTSGAHPGTWTVP
jgi:hypothetical protein